MSHLCVFRCACAFTSEAVHTRLQRNRLRTHRPAESGWGCCRVPLVSWGSRADSSLGGARGRSRVARASDRRTAALPLVLSTEQHSTPNGMRCEAKQSLNRSPPARAVVVDRSESIRNGGAPWTVRCTLNARKAQRQRFPTAATATVIQCADYCGAASVGRSS